MLATLMLQKMQLYKEQLHKKQISFPKGIHPGVKRVLLAKKYGKLLKNMTLFEHGFFHFFMKEHNI